MKIIKAGYEIISGVDNGLASLQRFEKVARTCYKSEDKITEDGESAKKLAKRILGVDHTAMIEFMEDIVVKFTCDRGVSHELVRHRLCSFAQVSTRYVNYGSEKNGKEITVILPCFLEGKEDTEEYKLWYDSCKKAEDTYLKMLELGMTPQEARSVLPNSTGTEVNMKANVREWMKIFSLRCAPAAHPQMREIMIPLYEECKEKIPLVFDNIVFNK